MIFKQCRCKYTVKNHSVTISAAFLLVWIKSRLLSLSHTHPIHLLMYCVSICPDTLTHTLLITAFKSQRYQWGYECELWKFNCQGVELKLFASPALVLVLNPSSTPRACSQSNLVLILPWYWVICGVFFCCLLPSHRRGNMRVKRSRDFKKNHNKNKTGVLSSLLIKIWMQELH